MKQDSNSSNPQQTVPSYYNPHNVEIDPSLNSNPLVSQMDPEEPVESVLKRKYPFRVIVGVAILVITVVTIPVGVYINQRPTRLLLEAETPTPSPTPSPTPTPTSTSQ